MPVDDRALDLVGDHEASDDGRYEVTAAQFTIQL
jgi:hypothetical protein